jgi:CheY-like chemotaxis protein
MIKIIVQDLDEGNREVLSLALESEGFRVLALSATEGVVERVNSFNPNLIILDFFMSGHESIKTCEILRLKYPSIPVIASSCNPNINVQAEKYGFNGYLAKPFDIGDLGLKVREYLNQVGETQ